MFRNVGQASNIAPEKKITCIWDLGIAWANEKDHADQSIDQEKVYLESDAHV